MIFIICRRRQARKSSGDTRAMTYFGGKSSLINKKRRRRKWYETNRHWRHSMKKRDDDSGGMRRWFDENDSISESNEGRKKNNRIARKFYFDYDFFSLTRLVLLLVSLLCLVSNTIHLFHVILEKERPDWLAWLTRSLSFTLSSPLISPRLKMKLFYDSLEIRDSFLGIDSTLFDIWFFYSFRGENSPFCSSSYIS